MKRLLALLLLIPALALGQVTTNPAVTGVSATIPGDFTQSIVSSPGVSLTSTTAKTVTSIQITIPGDYDICGFVKFSGAAGTLTTENLAGIQTTTDTLPANDDRALVTFIATGLAAYAADDPSITVPCKRVQPTSATTYYLIAYSSFSVSTSTAYGRLWARRWR